MMLINDVIETLENIWSEYGNIPVRLLSPAEEEGKNYLAKITTIEVEDGKVLIY